MNELTAQAVIDGLRGLARVDDGVFLARFFKTGEGEYGAGDIFIGVRVPDIRRVCRQFLALPLSEVQKLFHSKVHEHRLAAVILLADQYALADPSGKQAIFALYLANVRQGFVNNGDLVDSSAEFIIGEQLYGHSPDLLFDLARNANIWQRRVAILSSFAFVKKGHADITLQLAQVLLYDKEDLIQKAVGWMLREIGKRVSRQPLLDFLTEHAATMPRTTLRYAIEHLSPEQRKHFMGLKSQKRASL